MKQLKNLLKNHIIVKPACLFDQSIKLEAKVMFAQNGKYSEKHSRQVSFEMAQIQKASVRSELDHQYKYRFLALKDNGDLMPLYDPSQVVPGGAGDILLTFYGFQGSGFEFCDVTTQTLTRGSQYQTSFLPEMANGVDYKVRVNATYKDYQPIQFDLTVKYLPNLNGKTKFVDLGTHVFYKPGTPRPTKDYKFVLAGVTDDLDSDDQDDYKLSLRDGASGTYFTLDNQENEITLDPTTARGVPHIGENTVEVKEDGGVFLDSRRRFFNLPGQSTHIEIPLVSQLKDGEIAVVLTWTEGVFIDGNNAEYQNLDLHIQFQGGETVKCEVDQTMRQCNGVRLTADYYRSDNQLTQIQAAKFDSIGDFDYMVYASRNKKVVPNTKNAKNSQLEATLQIYAPHHMKPVYEVNLPFYT